MTLNTIPSRPDENVIDRILKEYPVTPLKASLEKVDLNEFLVCLEHALENPSKSSFTPFLGKP